MYIYIYIYIYIYAVGMVPLLLVRSSVGRRRQWRERYFILQGSYQYLYIVFLCVRNSHLDLYKYTRYNYMAPAVAAVAAAAAV